MRDPHFTSSFCSPWLEIKLLLKVVLSIWKRKLCKVALLVEHNLLTVGTPCWWECAKWEWGASFDILGMPGGVFDPSV